MKVKLKALYAHVAAELKAARRREALTQRDVADTVRLRPHSISTIEAGKQSLKLHQLYEMCVLLKLDPRSILPSVEEVTTKPKKYPVTVGDKIVYVTRPEAGDSIIKLDRLLGKK